MTDCKHMTFAANVAVARIEDTGKFMADVTVRCAECGEPFQFLGLEAGLDMMGARVSIDGLEARMAIAPNSRAASPFDRMMVAANVSH